MVAILYDASGTAVPDIVINEIKETKISRSIVHDITAMNRDTIQIMGTKNRKYTISGWAIETGSPASFYSAYFDTAEFDYSYFDIYDSSYFNLIGARSIIQQLVGNTGSLVSDIMSQTQLFFESVNIDDKGGRPREFKFDIGAVEVI